MSIKELRFHTGLSQSKFAAMFGIPVSTLKDWEQERRTPPSYVVNMIKKILELQGILPDDNDIDSCESRRRSVERVLAILYTATNGPDETFMKVSDFLPELWSIHPFREGNTRTSLPFYGIL